MALTLGNFIGFETGGLEEVSYTAGTPTADDAFPRTGRYCLQLQTSDVVAIDPFLNGVTQGDYLVIGFAVRFSDATPASELAFIRAYEVAGSPLWILSITTGGYLKITDNSSNTWTSVTTQLQDDTWYYIEVSWEQVASNAQMDVYLNEASEIAITTADFYILGNFYRYNFYGSADSDVYMDDIYYYSGASSGATDMLGKYARVIGPFANTLEDATDQGTTLTTGLWSNTGEVPFNDSNYAEYDGNDDQGHTRFDEGALENVVDSIKQFTQQGHKWISRNDYDGTKTPMYMRWGFEQSGGDWMTNESVTPTKAFVNYEFISDAVTDEDWMSLGHDNGGTGNDVRMSACVGMMLITQAPGAIATIADFNPRQENSYGGPFSV